MNLSPVRASKSFDRRSLLPRFQLVAMGPTPMERRPPRLTLGPSDRSIASPAAPPIGAQRAIADHVSTPSFTWAGGRVVRARRHARRRGTDSVIGTRTGFSTLDSGRPTAPTLGFGRTPGTGLVGACRNGGSPTTAPANPCRAGAERQQIMSPSLAANGRLPRRRLYCVNWE
jgi:hypothetical protein